MGEILYAVPDRIKKLDTLPEKDYTLLFDSLLDRTKSRTATWRDRFVELLNQTDRTINDIWEVFRQTDEWLEKTDCTHSWTMRVVYPLDNGQARQRFQCAGCGQLSGFKTMDKSREWPVFVDVVTPIRIAREEMREYAKAMADLVRGEKNADWWTWYRGYLETPMWFTRRDMVLERDNYRCTATLKGCTGRATQVHHLTYDHAGNEPLFELVSICENCHNQITEADRSRRRGIND